MRRIIRTKVLGNKIDDLVLDSWKMSRMGEILQGQRKLNGRKIMKYQLALSDIKGWQGETEDLDFTAHI